MQSVIHPELMFEKYERGTLSYLLLKPALLSSTGYKVLQGRERAGFACCVRVVDNGRDKLVYCTDALQPLALMLSSMKPDEFCVVSAGILNAFHHVRQTGFWDPFNIVCDLAHIFVEPGSFAVRLIYLPVSGVNLFGVDGFSAMKRLLVSVIVENAHLDSETVRRFGALLAEPGATLEQLRACLGDIPLPSGNVTATIGSSGEIRNTTGLVSMTGAISSSGDLDGVNEFAEAPATVKKEKSTSRFGKRQAAKAPDIIRDATGGTEVLDDIFVPVIVLEGVGTPKKIDLLVSKQGFVIGKKAELVDGLIDFSNAVSRVHCRINHNDGRNFITDLSSANGTFLNGKKLEPEKPTLLNEGDKIRVADVTFVIKDV